ncbi:MAG: hypothetical protein EPO02_01260 [Nitrospirae bacterium]|nr:MAG: hypothetical protein EPO02_01260 [Nitrospirota bacterium]
MTAAWVSSFIFIATLVLLLTDWAHRTIVAWAGAAAMIAAGLILGFYTQHQALASIDFNTLGLLLGMMMLMAMLAQTGAFEHLAVLAARGSRGSSWRLLVLLGTVTTVVSMFLNNLTVIALIGPVTLKVAEKLRINAVPLLIAEAVLSNIGGTATLIGDPPNTLIGSAAGLTFNSFLFVLLPIVAVAFYPTLLTLHHALGPQVDAPPERTATARAVTLTDSIKDPAALRKLLVVLALTITLFVLQDFVRLQIGFIAFAGAALALALLRPDPEILIKEVEWNTILFFICLFIIVGGLEAAGVMKAVANLLAGLIGPHVLLSAVLLIWVAAVLSAVVDNIPFVIAMIPIIKQLEAAGLAAEPLWWALALGAGFGGNSTPIGASANILAISLCERAGQKITFRQWMSYAGLATVVSCAVGTVVFLLIFGLIKS